MVLLWNPWRDTDGAAPVPIKAYEVHNHRVLDLAISADNCSFASCGGDRTVFVWDVTSGKVARRLHGHEQRINCVHYSHECAVLLSASYDKTVCCWDMRSKNVHPLQVLTGAADSVSAVCASDHEIFASSIDGNVLTYDMRKGSMARDTIGPPVGHVALSRDQNCVLCGTLDSTLRLLDKAVVRCCANTAATRMTLSSSAAASQDDSKVLSGSEEDTLHAWDLVEGKQLLKHWSTPARSWRSLPSEEQRRAYSLAHGTASYGSRRAPQYDSGSGRSCMIEEERTGGTKNAADDARLSRSLITS